MKKAILITLYAVLFSMTAIPSHADTPVHGDGEVQKNSPWSGDFETGIEYDSNIFQAKNQRESDLIWISALYFDYLPEKIRWTGLAVRNQYLDNSELSFSFFEIGAERFFGSRDYGRFALQVSPSAPLDKDESVGPPISLGSIGFYTSYDRDLKPWWNTGLSISYNRINYNARFDAKDTNVVKIGFPQFLRLNKIWRFMLDYAFQTGSARTGRVPTLNGTRPDDISFRANILSLQASYLLNSSTRVRISYRHRSKTYTTNNIDDLFHIDRKDNNHQVLLGLKHRMNPKVTLRTRVKYLWRDSTDPFVEFDEVTLSVSAAYRF
ncbi:MAG: hypothetical protein ACE5FY_05885 [Nitrospiria bacterium]